MLGFAQAYPNPFREAATIRYSLPSEAVGRLVVYDVLGREVAVLADGRAAAGLHALTVDASGWPPGVYLVRLQVDGHTFTRMLLRAR